MSTPPSGPSPNPRPHPPPPQPADTLSPSPVAAALVRASEGFRAEVYRDANGNATIGYGHKIINGENFDCPITESQADALMLQDLDFAGKCLQRLVTVPLTQWQFDALCDFAFNEGCGQLADSTLLRVLNLGEYMQASNELLRWVYAGGRVLAGLEKRRNAELEIWETGTFSED